ncbi:1-phosphofructokinase [Vreelandella populi]|uniref:Phosphofructokinase n=1 Tax=Vreelandella populi TaxID=2498858 RepID=A0A433LHB0_9GAMM|nr:1-phosphofructokinase [Halomonas populi]RUR40900.1 1-phosphofructokinase [Halomonas populi]RUR49408.1 1-phosphofructokinase [Halomonas populi]RUR55892.1 1-phosphofructokinase [Halomonas populi]
MARVICITLNPALDLAFELEELALGAVNRPKHAQLEAAGKGVNVARVLATLGHDVVVSGFLGRDNDGPFQLAFKHMGVTDAFVRVPGETRINAKLAEKSGRVTDINGPGIGVDAEQVGILLGAIEQQLNDTSADAILVAGSLPPGLSLATFGELLTRLKATGIPLWVDTSGEALLRAIEIAPEAVKPNELELADWAGSTLESHASRVNATTRLNQAGIGQALLSAGAEGVIWVNARGAWQAIPPSVQAVNTVGAGDTFVAGMLHGLLSHQGEEETLRFATALSAESVRHVGVGTAQADDFSLLLERTRVRHLHTSHTEGAL